MSGIKLITKYADKYINKIDLLNIEDKLRNAHEILHRQEGLCNNGAEWIDYPTKVSDLELNNIISIASKAREKNAFIVIGIGGSYLGARAAISALTHTFYNQLGKDRTGNPEIYFAGYNIDPDYLLELLEIINHKDVVINVISKSGTTFETLLAFRHLKEALITKYGEEEALSRIIVTTGDKGLLRDYTNKYDLVSLPISDNISGRYSVLSTVGLLPMAVAGINIRKVMEGAKEQALEMKDFRMDHPSYLYAAIRYLLYQSGKKIEVFSYYKEKLRYFAEWYKQLFAESEGKEGKGLFPTSLMFTTDLHSLGQLLQSGDKTFMQTSLVIKNSIEMKIKDDNDDLGNLNYLAGVSYNEILNCVKNGVVNAHYSGDSPNLMIELESLDEKTIGKLFYFFQKSCALSSLLLELNPFNQPGVEEYKREIKINLDTICERDKK
jgi:glucose-6-phosphate isomerase